LSLFAKFSPTPIIKWLGLAVCLAFLFWKARILSENSIETKYNLIPFNLEANNFWLIVASFLLSSLSVGTVLKINQQQRFVENSSTIIPFYFLISLIAFPFVLLQLNVALATFLLFLSVRILLQIHKQPSVKLLIFNAAALAGFASLFFAPFFFMIIPILTAISMFRTFKSKNFILAIVAFILPHLYFLGVVFLLNLNFGFLETTLRQLFHFKTVKWELLTADSLPLYVFGLILLLAYADSFRLKPKLIVRQRKQFSVLLYLNLIFLLIALIYGLNYGLVPLIIGSSSFILLFYDKGKLKWLFELALLFIFGYSVFGQFFL